MTNQIPQGNLGPATDRHNDPVIDPTQNVLQLVQAAVTRLDDLRILESTHIREMFEIRGQHTKDMRLAEADRINAIRLVDVQAVQRAAEVQAAQASAIANTVTASAEAMRTQVQAAAAAAEANLKASLEPMQKAIADLSRTQYELAGQRTQIGETRQVNSATYALIGIIITIVLASLTILGFILGTQ